MLKFLLLGIGGHHQNQYSKKHGKHNPDMIKYLFYDWVCSKGSLRNICHESMVRTITNGLYAQDAVLSHVVCDLVNTVNDIDKYIRIIEDYDTAKKLFTAEYIFVGEKVRKNKVSELFPSARDDIQNQRR